MVKRPSSKPLLTLEQMLPSPKDRPASEEQTNVIYRKNCADCSWSYNQFQNYWDRSPYYGKCFKHFNPPGPLFNVVFYLPSSLMNQSVSTYNSTLIGEGGGEGKKEHMKNVEKHKAGSNITNHAWSFDHKIDFKNCKIIDKANYRHRDIHWNLGTLRLQLMLITIPNIYPNNTVFTKEIEHP